MAGEARAGCLLSPWGFTEGASLWDPEGNVCPPPPGSLRPTHGAPSQNLEQLQELAVVRMSPGSSLKH